MRAYQDLVRHVRDNGNNHPNDRTGVGTRNVVGALMRWWLPDGFPAVTVKHTATGNVKSEQLWLLSGNTDLKFLLDNNNHIWDEWVLPGTEVWGETPYTLEERWKIFLRGWEREQYDGKQLHALGLSYDVALPESNKQKQIVLDALNIYTHPLLDGKLGKVYGQQQRAWDDTRTVTRDAYYHGKYSSRGYKVIGEYHAKTDDESNPRVDMVVIQRKVDQLKNAIDTLKTNPDSRRIIVMSWNPGELEDMALPPCHMDYQFTTTILTLHERMELFNALLAKAHLKAVLPAMPEPDFNEELVHAIMDRYEVPKRRLNCIFHMRSIDVGLGLPFNIASYAMLTHMVAQCVNMEVGELVWLGGDVHIYDNHQKLYKILERDPLPLCQIKLNPEVKKIDDFKMSDIEILNYKSHPKITLPVAV